MTIPADLHIEQRDLRYEIDPDTLRSWHPEGPHVAHFFNALSILFPEGEKMFIEAVRHYRARIEDPELASDLQAFVGQEAMHSREHRRYNDALAEAGLPAKALEAWLRGFLARLKERAPSIELLAGTIALEHFTAILAGSLLEEDGLGDSEIARVWRWHAIEETEHKAVAYDVFEAVTRRPFQAYLLRCGVMLSTTIIFWLIVFRFHWVLVRADGKTRDWRGWLRFGHYLWIRPGVLRRLFLPWASYFRPGFHPWQDDNLHVVDRWKSDLETA